MVSICWRQNEHVTFKDLNLKRCRPVSSVGKHIAIGAGGLGFDSWAGQIGRCVATAAPPLTRHRRATAATFLRRYVVQALSCIDGPAIRYTLRRNTEVREYIKNWIF